MSENEDSFQSILESIPGRYRGPGGAVAIVKDGELAAQHVWGFANLEQRIPLQPSTIMPICSISKQMVCYCLVALERDPATMPFDAEAAINDLLPNLSIEDKRAAIQDMKNMSSGIRDYWALTTLCGAQVEGRFTMSEHAPEMRKLFKSYHFKPGSEFSYSNTNWHVLGLLAEMQAGHGLEGVLKERLFTQAGMTTAQLGADTSTLPGPCKGYEGDETHGHTPAVNKIVWEGDAGIVASLNDMIAYEKHLHRSWDDEGSIYRALAREQVFVDGTPTRYGNGLSRDKVGSFAAMGHGGGLRGFSLHRRHVPEKRLSAIVMFNHMANASTAGSDILKRVLKVPTPAKTSTLIRAPEWEGVFFDANTQLAHRVTRGKKDNEIVVSNSHSETVKLTAANQAESPNIIVEIDGDSLEMNSLSDHRKVSATRLKSTLAPGQAADYIGDYRCEEIDSAFHCTGDGKSGMLYGSFEGFLGRGPTYLVRHAGDDVWSLANPRAMDEPAPGDWTLAFQRDHGKGVVSGTTIGCWLARKLEYVRV